MKTEEQENTTQPCAGAVADGAVTPHSAPGASAGFTYQFGRALWWLATKPGDFSVAIETLDDICIKNADGSTTLEQDKYSIRDAGHPVSDRSVALWKTLANWLGVFDTADREYGCLLVTNRPVPSESLVRRLSDAETDEAIETLVAEIHEIAAEPAAAIRPYAEAVRSASLDVLGKLVRAIRLASSDSASTEWADLREAALGALHLPSSMQPHGSSLLDEILGWLVHCCMQAWHQGSPARITSQSFNNALHRAIDTRQRQHNRERPPARVLLTSEDLKGQATSTYVKQLDLVDAEQSELQNAIHDCVRYGKEVLRLTNTGEYTPQDWSDLEDELEQRWERIFARFQRLNASEDESRRGYRVFHETTDDSGPVRSESQSPDPPSPRLWQAGPLHEVRKTPSQNPSGRASRPRRQILRPVASSGRSDRRRKMVEVRGVESACGGQAVLAGGGFWPWVSTGKPFTALPGFEERFANSGLLVVPKCLGVQTAEWPPWRRLQGRRA